MPSKCLYGGFMSNAVDELRQYLKTLPVLSDKNREQRIAKAKTDFRFFVQTYLLHHINECKKETSVFRNFVYNDLPKLSTKQRKILIEAYRGAAKTTMISRLFSMWRILTVKRYTVFLNSTMDLAHETMETIQAELEENAGLVADFDIKKGDTWTKDEIVFSVGGVIKKMKGFGAGKKLRGMNFMSRRPDDIYFDDLENDENVESPTQRNKLYRWFTRAVLKLVARTSKDYNITGTGTRIHHDSLLARIKKRSDFVSYNFPLVLQFPTRLDEITKDNISKEMIKGVKLDDPQIDSLEVMQDFLEDKESFYSEYQNEPLSKEGLTFSTYTTFSTMPLCDMYVIGADPALGKKKGDFFGVSLMGGLQKEKKFFWQGWGYKVAPVKMIDIIIKLYVCTAALGRPVKLAIETVAFQEFFKDQLKARAKELSVLLAVEEIKNTVDKQLRVESLSPFVEDGTISVCEDSHLLIEEMCTYPKAAHDDVLDSGEMAWRGMKKGMRLDYKTLNRVQKEMKSYIKKDIYG
jgi:predicted phage terminase large subunit-like protein